MFTNFYFGGKRSSKFTHIFFSENQSLFCGKFIFVHMFPKIGRIFTLPLNKKKSRGANFFFLILHGVHAYIPDSLLRLFCNQYPQKCKELAFQILKTMLCLLHKNHMLVAQKQHVSHIKNKEKKGIFVISPTFFVIFQH